MVPRDDLSDDDKFASALERLGTEVTRASYAGFGGMMRDAHATLVPEDAIKGILQWADGLTTTSHWAIAEAPNRPVLRGISSGAELLGLSNASTRLTTDIEEQPLQVMTVDSSASSRARWHGAAASRPAIILASAGAVHRIGASRLYVTMARAWAERGFPVLRLDIGGIGDSLPFPGMTENDTYSARAVADIGEAAAALPEECRTAGLVVAGLCSGAHVAFHAALTLRGIVGIIMMNPIVFYWKPSDALEVSAWMTHKEVRRYQQRVTSLDSWRRVLQGKVDLLFATRTVGSWIRSRMRAHGRTLLRGVLRRHHAEGPESRTSSRTSRGSPIRASTSMLVFSQGEPGFFQLHAQYRDALDRLKRLPRFTYHEVAWSGHTFTNVRAQQALLGMLTDHLTTAFPVSHT